MPHTNVAELKRITAAHQADLNREADERDDKDTAQAFRTVSDWAGLAAWNLGRLEPHQVDVIDLTLADDPEAPLTVDYPEPDGVLWRLHDASSVAAEEWREMADDAQARGDGDAEANRAKAEGLADAASAIERMTDNERAAIEAIFTAAAARLNS